MKNILLFLFAALLVASCVKDKYNKDLSTEMELFSDGINFPIGYTDAMKLDSFLSDMDYLYIDENHNYYVSLQDTLKFKFPEMNKLKIEEKTHIDVLAEPEESGAFSGAPRKPRSLTKEAIDKRFIFRDTFCLDYNSNVPKELVAFKSAAFKNPANIRIRIQLLDVPVSFQNENIDITFSSTMPDLFKLDRPGNKFMFSGQIKGNNSLTETVSFYGFEKEMYFPNHKLIYTGNLYSDIIIGVSELIGTPAPADIERLKDIKVGLTIEVSEVEIKSIIGKVNFVLDTKKMELDLSSLVENIGQDDNNVLDITRTDLWMHTKTDIDIPFSASLKLTPFKKSLSGTSLYAPLYVDKKEKSFFFSNVVSNLPAGYDTIIKIDIPGLFKSIPTEMEIEWTGKTDSSRYSAFDFTADYSLSGISGINIPLAFGKDLSISLRDTIHPDINIESYETYLRTGSIVLSGEVISTFPFSINMEINALDENAFPVDGLHFVKNIPNKNFSIELKSSQIELLKRTRQWEIVFKITVPNDKNNVSLSKNDYVKLINFKLKKIGGVIVNDLNSL